MLELVITSYYNIALIVFQRKISSKAIYWLKMYYINKVLFAFDDFRFRRNYANCRRLFYTRLLSIYFLTNKVCLT